ncbi:ThiF family adenylyltransferase [Microbacterium sulfonylureivorans]|uniref:ThiF family adenylyltransferase n=1 Tax=Microbacterium sulfonylureivorans TaxID=2486854 RepID=UPI000FDADC6F|nr:ThiF family adenylyltransferase [Microbacterium sulfonylureivorans]
MNAPWSVRITQNDWHALAAHLFPGDRDEHAAILRCGLARTPRGNRLLVHDVLYAVDGTDYVPGDRGYRKLTPEFVLEAAESCADDELVYVAVHCHGGTERVEFSEIDMASHERGYPALLDITDRPAVGALVFARNAVAGDIWLADGTRVPIDHLQVLGRPQTRLHPEPRRPAHAGEAFDRQSRIFGDRGQHILATQRVAIIGLGGAGSLINEYLARLGVGEILVIDPDRIEMSNLSRVVGARRGDAWSLLTTENRPEWLRRIGRRLSAPKVKIAARVAREASRTVTVTAVFDDVLEPDVAELLLDCDHIFLAADSHSARRLVDALTHQYFIPNTQVGAKVSLVKDTGDIADIFSAVRASVPGDGCLRCAQLINPVLLQEEAKSHGERRRQRYLDDDDVPAPSVITLNALAAAHAVNDWMMSITGLTSDLVEPHRWITIHPLTDEIVEYAQRHHPSCPNCGLGRFARGDARRLPTKVR